MLSTSRPTIADEIDEGAERVVALWRSVSVTAGRAMRTAAW